MELKHRKYGLPLLIIFYFILGGFCYVDTIHWLLISWSENPYYVHGFPVFFLSLGMLLYSSKNGSTSSFHPSLMLFLVLTTVSVALYIFGIVLNFYFILATSLMFFLISFLVAFNLISRKSISISPLFTILLVIPVPFLQEVTALLQIVTVTLTTYILASIGFPVSSEGALILLPQARFFVGEPSSGIQSLLALLCLMGIIVYFSNLRKSKKAILFFVTIPISITSNIMRVITLVLVGHYFGEKTAGYFWHDYGNWVFSLVSIFALLSIWYFFHRKETQK